MDVEFGSRKLHRACNSERESNRKWGDQNGKKIRQRLAELAAAESLADIGMHPGARLHQLKGDREGQFAVDVKQPFRLVFEPAQDPVPLKDDGGIDLEKITRIRVVYIGDYHG